MELNTKYEEESVKQTIEEKEITWIKNHKRAGMESFRGGKQNLINNDK